MDTQAWWEKLVAQLAGPNPNRQTVVECLRNLLMLIREGEPLPTEGE